MEPWWNHSTKVISIPDVALIDAKSECDRCNDLERVLIDLDIKTKVTYNVNASFFRTSDDPFSQRFIECRGPGETTVFMIVNLEFYIRRTLFLDGTALNLFLSILGSLTIHRK